MEATKKNSAIGTTGFIFGIASLVLSCIMVGGFTGIVGIVLCIIALAEKNTKKELAIIGVILNTIAVILVILLVIGSFSKEPEDAIQTSVPSTEITSTSETETKETDSSYATLEKFNQIKTGMTYEEVVEIMGSEGTVMSEATVLDTTVTVYYWYSWNHISNMNISVTDGIVTAKAQIGLD